MMGVNLSAGGSLQWFRNRAVQGRSRSGQAIGRRLLRNCSTAEAAAVPPGSQGLFFLPYLSGERTPHADPDARGCFIGLTLAHGRGHMVRVDHGRRDLRDARQPGDHPRAWRAGAADSGVAAAARAARCGGRFRPTCSARRSVTINAEEGPAYGVALLAAVGAGAFKNIQEACRPTIRVVEAKPLSQRRAAAYYDRGVSEYQQLYRSLKDDFKTHRGAGRRKRSRQSAGGRTCNRTPSDNRQPEPHLTTDACLLCI